MSPGRFSQSIHSLLLPAISFKQSNKLPPSSLPRPRLSLSPSFSQTHTPLHSPTNNSTYPLFHSHPFTTTLTPNLSHPSTFLVVSTRRRRRERHARFNTQPQIQGTYLTFLLSVSSYIHTSNIRAGSDCSGPLTYASRIY